MRSRGVGQIDAESLFRIRDKKSKEGDINNIKRIKERRQDRRKEKDENINY